MPSSKKTFQSAPRAARSRAKAPPRPRLPTHSFALVYPGSLDDISNAEMDALYEAGLADALLSSRDGEISITLDRADPSFRVALLSAIFDVEKAGVPLELIRVEPVEALDPPESQGGQT